MKTKSSGWYRKQCVNWAKKQARLNARETCQRCGRSKYHGYAMHGSHIYPEGAYIAMSADVDNILCLCYLCHFRFWHVHPIEAAKWFKEKFPKLAKVLHKRAKEIKIIDWKKRYDEIRQLS